MPAPPDAPQPKGQLLDFIDALKKHRPPILTPKKKPGRGKTPPAPALHRRARQPPAQGGGAIARHPPDRPPPARPPPAQEHAATAGRHACCACEQAERRARRPSRAGAGACPRGAGAPRSFKVAAAVTIASLAVAYQESAPAAHGGPRRRHGLQPEHRSCAHAMQLTGHKGPVVAVASSDQGRWIVSAGADATLARVERGLGRAGAHHRARRGRADRARRRRPPRAGRAQGRRDRAVGPGAGREDRPSSSSAARRHRVAGLHRRPQHVCRRRPRTAPWPCSIRARPPPPPCCSTAATAPA